MFFSCCKSTEPVLDDVSIQKALQARRGEVVIATVGSDVKTTDCDSLGLVLKLVPLHQEEEQQQQQQQHQNPKLKHAIVVESIHPQSPLQQSGLKPGMILFQINNINIENQSIARIEHFLRTATVRPLRLWAQVPTHSKEVATDSTADSSRATSKETPHHAEDNRRSSNNTNKAASKKSTTLCSTKTILAVAHKEEVNQPLGIVLQRSESGKFIIEKIDPTSPFYPQETSLLREGMIVTSINGLSITGMGKAAAVSAMEDAPASVLLSADVPPEMEEPPILRKRIVATIYKNSPDMRLGLSLVRIPNSSKNRKFTTVVSRMAPYCPFRDTNLDIGMEITSVNGMDVSKSTAREILHYLQERAGKVTILAEMDVPAEESVCTSVASISHSTLSSSSRTGASHPEAASTNNHNNAGQPATTHSRTSGNTGTNGSNGTHPRPLPPLPGHHPFPAQRSGSVTSSNKTPPTGPSKYGVGIQTATVMKLSTEQVLGLAFTEPAPGVFLVSQISHDSPFYHTPLQVGAQVFRINGIQLSGVDMTFVQMLLYKAVGEVVIDFVAPREEYGMGYSTAGNSNSSW